jgi:hypothetical protein
MQITAWIKIMRHVQLKHIHGIAVAVYIVQLWMWLGKHTGIHLCRTVRSMDKTRLQLNLQTTRIRLKYTPRNSFYVRKATQILVYY